MSAGWKVPGYRLKCPVTSHCSGAAYENSTIVIVESGIHGSGVLQACVQSFTLLDNMQRYEKVKYIGQEKLSCPSHLPHLSSVKLLVLVIRLYYCKVAGLVRRCPDAAFMPVHSHHEMCSCTW